MNNFFSALLLVFLLIPVAGCSKKNETIRALEVKSEAGGHNWSLKLIEHEGQGVEISLYSSGRLHEKYYVWAAQVGRIETLRKHSDKTEDIYITLPSTFSNFQARKGVVVWRDHRGNWQIYPLPFYRPSLEELTESGRKIIVERMSQRSEDDSKPERYTFANGILKRLP